MFKVVSNLRHGAYQKLWTDTRGNYPVFISVVRAGICSSNVGNPYAARNIYRVHYLASRSIDLTPGWESIVVSYELKEV